ncbi:hypothetical protein V8E54_013227 [Elaphomyces granulatus]
MSAARQLLKALECLHNANIVHHIHWSAQEDSPTIQFVEAGRVTPFKAPKRLITDAVYLGGFKMATEAGTEVRDKVPSPMNIHYYASEIFHDVNPSFASDMWSYRNPRSTA